MTTNTTLDYAIGTLTDEATSIRGTIRAYEASADDPEAVVYWKLRLASTMRGIEILKAQS